MRRRLLVEYLRTVIGIRDERVLEAIAAVPREVFVPPSLFHQAYEDFPLEIGEGQTISQPSVVARMTELAAVGERDRVLEIGAGSGYQVAVLAHAGALRLRGGAPVAPRRGRQGAACASSASRNVSIQVMDGTLGWRAQAPFDAIIVSAAAPAVPQALKEQLVEGGRLVIPVGDLRRQELHRVVRRGEALDGDPPRRDELRAAGRPRRLQGIVPMVARRYLVSGRVQGVGFRYFVMREAVRSPSPGGCGTSRTGGSRPLAAADEVVLHAFEGRLWQGPPHARVTALDSERAEPPDRPGFDVLPTPW